MPEFYTFNIELSSEGNTPEEAWINACTSFTENWSVEDMPPDFETAHDVASRIHRESQEMLGQL